MNAVDQSSFSLFAVTLFGLALFLKTKFPNASRRVETVVLVAVTALFFSGCTLFLGAR